MKLGSLCTGYGGLDMAVERYFDAETVWVSEIDKPASQLIKKRIDKPNLGNLKIIDWANVEPIDIITAGYPCQPFSTAGNRKGADDERHLWPYIKTAISILRPRFIVLENVRGHFGLGFGDVLSDLAHIGYNARWTLVRASDVGAPHRRERLFIVAYPIGARFTRTEPVHLQSREPRISRNNFNEHSNTNSQRCTLGENTSNEVKHQRQSQPVVGGLVETIIANSNGVSHNDARRADGNLSGKTGKIINGSNRVKPRFSLAMAGQAIPTPLEQGRLNVEFVEYMMGLPKGWVTDVGLSRAQQLKILGNGVVPQQAYYALQLLLGQ